MEKVFILDQSFGLMVGRSTTDAAIVALQQQIREYKEDQKEMYCVHRPREGLWEDPQSGDVEPFTNERGRRKVYSFHIRHGP